MLSERANLIAAVWGAGRYDAVGPYSPGERFAEYPFGDAVADCGGNSGYAGVRMAMQLLGLDRENQGLPGWNPLGGLIQSGHSVVIKPNFIRHFRDTQDGLGDCVITHGAIIRAVVDYAFIALQGKGRIIIADAPQNDADFEVLCRETGLRAIQQFYRQHAGFEVEVLDLRPNRVDKVNGVIVREVQLPGDPAGYVKVDLATRSMFMEVNHLARLFYGSEYDMGELYRHHHDQVHEYLLSRTVLQADCVISLGKLKTHKKTGLTACLKNMVGVNGNKNWLPHHREGTPGQGGDQFPCDGMKQNLERGVVAAFKKVFPYLGGVRPLVAGPIKKLGNRLFGDTTRDTIRSGNWHGNDTTWRMVLDLSRAAIYADCDGVLHEEPQRKLFCLVDGIVGGEGNGPLDPRPREVGVVLAGLNPLAVDMACSKVMGFDWRRIPLLNRAWDSHPLPLASFGPQELEIRSNQSAFDGPFAAAQSPIVPFEPHFGWKQHLQPALVSA